MNRTYHSTSITDISVKSPLCVLLDEPALGDHGAELCAEEHVEVAVVRRRHGEGAPRVQLRLQLQRVVHALREQRCANKKELMRLLHGTRPLRT